MIRHIVLWKMHDFAEGKDKDANMDYVIKELEEIKKEFPLLRKLNCHKSIRSGGAFWDLILEMEFDKLEDLDKYQVFPKHAALHAFAVKVRQDRAVVDYELS